MALLTAEDVLNKAFSKTKYREGFDQDEVDDFLDEVATTIAALTAERDQFAARLAAGGGATAPAPAPAGTVEPAQGSSLLAAATDPNPPSATSMIAMAQKLHDEYLSAGEAEKEKIIADAKVQADQLLANAELDAKNRMGSLEAERAELERKIDDLRRFERDYRSHLKSYLENLLGDISHGEQRGTGAVPTVSTPAAAPVPAPAAERAPEPFVSAAPSNAPTGTVPTSTVPAGAVPAGTGTANPAPQPTSGITPMPQWPTA